MLVADVMEPKTGRETWREGIVMHDSRRLEKHPFSHWYYKFAHRRMCFWTRIVKCAETMMMMMNQYPCGWFVVNKGGYKLVTKPSENRSESRDQKLNIRALYYNTNFASAAAASPRRREKVRRRVLMWIKSRSLHNILRDDRTKDQWQMRVASRENGPASTRIGCARWCRCNFPLVIIQLEEKVRVRRRYEREIDVTFLLNLLDHWIILLGSKKKKRVLWWCQNHIKDRVMRRWPEAHHVNALGRS